MKFSTTYQPALRRQRFVVFVYGSLRKGFGNHRLLDQPSTKFIGEASIRAKLYTQHWGWPFIAFSRSQRNRVVGEIYEVDYTTFCHLDSLEGYSRRAQWCLFNRKHAIATLKTGLYNYARRTKVWVYEGGHGLQQSSGSTEITSGDWKIAKIEHDGPHGFGRFDRQQSYTGTTDDEEDEEDDVRCTSHTDVS